MPSGTFAITLKANVGGFVFEMRVPVIDQDESRDGECNGGNLKRILSIDDVRDAFGELKMSLEAQGVVLRLESAGEPCDDRFLRRWVTAKKGSIDVAKKAIREHAEWRGEYVSKGRITEGEVANELAARKCFLQGCDKEGRSVLVVLARRHDMGHRDLKETQRFICYVLDNASTLADQNDTGNGKICCLFDLSGLRLRNLDAKGLGSIFQLLQQHYPERLDALWFLNAPFIFWGVWRVVSPFISPTTRQKIHFANSRNSCDFLKESVPPPVLPSVYGGSANLIPIDRMVQTQILKTPTHPGESVTLTLSGRNAGRVKRAYLGWWRPFRNWRGAVKNRVTRGVRNWKGVYNNRFTRACSRGARLWALGVWKRVRGRRYHVEGQVPLQLIPKHKREQSYMPNRGPFRAIMVKVLVAELVIIAFAQARYVVWQNWVADHPEM